MGKFVYIFLVLFLSIAIQIIAGNLGLIIPLMVLSVFYITVIFNWETGIMNAVLSGIAVDMLYGRNLFISPFINIAAVFMAILWLHKGELKVLSFQMVPGAILSMMYIVPLVYLTYQQTEHGIILALENIGTILVSMLITTLLFPCVIKLLDMINKPLGFNYYRASQERISKNE